MRLQRNLCFVTIILSIAAGIWFAALPVAAGETESDAATAKFMPNVVQLMVTFSDQSIEHGFGFVIGEQANQLYVLTANHVVRKRNPAVTMQNIQATFCTYQAESFTPKLLKIYNDDLDFALLKIEKPFPDYQWESDSFDSTPERGESVWFIGKNDQCVVPVTAGVIEQEDSVIKGKFSVDHDKVQPGTSGAPLISKQGIVGLITTDSLDGVFAVSTETICQLVVKKGVPCGSNETVTPPSTEWKEPVTGMIFLPIPKGCFQMGCGANDTECSENEKPAHEVCVDGFWMGKYEVTNAEFRKWKSTHSSGNFQGQSLHDDQQPAVEVTWNDANAFAEWLTQQSKGKETFRLPTEAEWEYAARAGTTTSRYWGDNPDDACQYANVADNSVAQFSWNVMHNCNDSYAVTSPVGKFLPNAFGLYDMLGNAWEWCQDIYRADAYQQQQPTTWKPGERPDISGYIIPGQETDRVLRGGSWVSYLSPSLARSAYRASNRPDNHDYNFGFRLVRVSHK